MISVLSSATEAETGALFHNAKDAAPFRITLIKLGHPPGATPIQTNKACALGIINDNLADYFTKHHSPSHHRLMRSRYLVNLHRPASLQGCVEPAA
jgi:hypothetical protein